eukprot:3938574-Rhodomonas_salina.2
MQLKLNVEGVGAYRCLFRLSGLYGAAGGARYGGGDKQLGSWGVGVASEVWIARLGAACSGRGGGVVAGI